MLDAAMDVMLCNRVSGTFGVASATKMIYGRAYEIVIHSVSGYHGSVSRLGGLRKM